MKIGFSSVACPKWDLGTIIARAKEMGYDGVELRGLEGQSHLPAVPALAADPDKTRARFADAGVELVCLASDAAFDASDSYAVADQKAKVREYIELAGALGVPFVRVLSGYTARSRWFGFEPREKTMARIGAALCDLAPVAAQERVTVVIENQGDFSATADQWWFLDVVSHPAVGGCYSPFNSMTVRERPTTSVPRMGRRTRLVQITDGRFDASGRLIDYVPPGQGDVEIRRCVQLLRGMGYDGYLMVMWPKLHAPDLAEPDQVLPGAAKFLRSLIDEKSAVLTAYKSDKNAPTFGTAPAGPPARATA